MLTKTMIQALNRRAPGAEILGTMPINTRRYKRVGNRESFVSEQIMLAVLVKSSELSEPYSVVFFPGLTGYESYYWSSFSVGVDEGSTRELTDEEKSGALSCTILQKYGEDFLKSCRDWNLNAGGMGWDRLAANIDEMRQVRDYFKTIIEK